MSTPEQTPQMPFKLVYSAQLKANVLVDANDVPIDINAFIGAFVDAFNQHEKLSEQLSNLIAENERLKGEQMEVMEFLQKISEVPNFMIEGLTLNFKDGQVTMKNYSAKTTSFN